MTPTCCNQSMTDLGYWPQHDKHHHRIGCLVLRGWRCEKCKSLKKTNDQWEVISVIGEASA